jgi:hypothetical protein
MTNNGLQNTLQKTKDRATRTPLNPGMNSGAPKGYAVLVPLLAPVVLQGYSSYKPGEKSWMRKGSGSACLNISCQSRC